MKIKEIEVIVDESSVNEAVDSISAACLKREDKNAFIENLKIAISDFFETYLNYALTSSEKWELNIFESRKAFNVFGKVNGGNFDEFKNAVEKIGKQETGEETEEEKSLFFTKGVDVFANSEKRQIKVCLYDLISNFEEEGKNVSVADILMKITEKFYNGCRERYDDLLRMKELGYDVFDVDLEGYEDLLGKEFIDLLSLTKKHSLSLDSLLFVAKNYQALASGVESDFSKIVDNIEKTIERDDKYFEEDVQTFSFLDSFENLHGIIAARSVMLRLFKDLYAEINNVRGENKNSFAALFSSLNTIKNGIEKVNKWGEQENVDISQESFQVAEMLYGLVEGFNEEIYFEYLKKVYESDGMITIDKTAGQLSSILDSRNVWFINTKEFIKNVLELAKEGKSSAKNKKETGFYECVEISHSAFLNRLNLKYPDKEDGEIDNV